MSNAGDVGSGEHAEQSDDAVADRSVPHDARAILTAPSVADRVQRIVGMMSRFEWVRGQSCKALAAEWGLSVNAVEQSSAEASRIVKMALDASELHDLIGGIARGALIKANETKDTQGIARMASTLMDLVPGLRAPTKVEQKITGTTLDEIDALKKSALANECPETPDEPNS